MNLKVVSVGVLLILCGLLPVQIYSDSRQLYDKGRSLQQMEDWYAAIEFYQESLRENPAYTASYVALAECFYELEEYEQAFTQIRKASALKKNDPSLMNLEGFTLIGLGRIPEAQTVFAEILGKWPNNIEARYGLAELDVLSGRVTAAASQYAEALRRSPENRKALLSLALLARETGDLTASREYIARALTAYGNDARVFYLAGYLSYLAGNFGEAERYTRMSLSINPTYGDSVSLLSTVLYSMKRYTEVIQLCDERIAVDRNSPLSWYLKALSLEKTGKLSESVQAASIGVSIAPQDELLRALMENNLMKAFAFEDSRRKSPAAWHSLKALSYEKQNLSSQAASEYMRALRIDPYSLKDRLSYANLLLAQGYPARHLSQLQFLKTLGLESVPVKDAIENWSKILVTSIQTKWGIDPLYLDKSHTSIGFYHFTDSAQLLHPDAERIISGMLSEELGYDSRFKPGNAVSAVTSYSQAFRMSREAKEDYFALVSFSENERDVRISLDLYVSKTGSKAETWSVFRTGNDRYSKAVRRMIELLTTSMPVRGSLIGKSQLIGLINLGKVDKLEKEMAFDIVPMASVSRKPEGIGLVYDSASILGTFTVTGIDEDVAEGSIARNGFFDRINPGDAVILVEKKDKQSPSDALKETEIRVTPALFDLLRKIR